MAFARPVALVALMGMTTACNSSSFQTLLYVPPGATARDVTQTADGGYAISGFGAGAGDLFVLKTSALGAAEWTRTYGGPYGDLGASIRTASDGGLILCGQIGTADPNHHDALVVRTEPDGEVRFSYRFESPGSDSCTEAFETSDGHVLASITSGAGDASAGLVAVLLDGTGQVSWSKTLHRFGGGAAETPDHGFVFASHEDSGGDSDVLLIRTDASGNELWRHRYLALGSQSGGTVTATAEGFVVIAGLVTCDLYCDSTPWIVETDASGNELDTVHVNAVLFPSDGVLTADGGFAFARSADPPAGGLQDIQLIVTDPAGSPLVTKTYGRASTDEASGLDRTADGGYVIVGRSVDSGPSPKIYLIKTDANGEAGPNPP